MKHGVHQLEPVVKARKKNYDMNIMYLPKRGVICETVVFTKSNLQVAKAVAML